MDEPVVFLNLMPGAGAPEYRSSGAAGADLRARLDAPVELRPGATAVIPTGVRIQLPSGYEAQVRSRSGLAAKHGVSCLNAPGTIDSDYRGEIGVILHNHGVEPISIADGDRIAQLVVAPVSRARFVDVDSLSDTDRGAGGFGSTGR
ncbi:MAG TPA: dUTP diphosphatase [Spirochaetales bacterium]|nr:dUTP diphosphatase [Spirochaetales bacterium]